MRRSCSKKLPCKAPLERIQNARGFKTTRFKTKLFGRLAGIAAAFLIYLLPLDLEPMAKVTLALTAWLIIWLIARPIDSGYTGLIYIVLQLLLRFPPPAVFTWFTISAGWFQMASFVIAAVMVRSGIAKRMAYTLMYKLKANTVHFMFASVIVVLLMIILIPSPTALIAIMIPLMVYVAEAWNLPARSEVKKGVAALALPTFFLIILAGNAGTWIRTGFSLNLVTMALSGVDIPWMEWFLHAAPIVWLFGFLTVILLVAVFRPAKDIIAHQDTLRTKYEERVRLPKPKIRFAHYAGGSDSLDYRITARHIHRLGCPGSGCVFAVPQLRLFKNFDDVVATINWPIMFSSRRCLPW